MIKSEHEPIQGRLQIILLIQTAAFLVTLAISWKLWLNVRDFPLIPVLDWIPLPAPMNAILLGAMVLLSLILPFLKKPAWAILAIFSLLTLAMLADYNRLQPMFLHFWIQWPLLLLYFFRRKNGVQVLETLRILMVFIYFWTGVHKLNPNFIHVVFPWFVSPFVPESLETSNLISSLAYLVPLTEIFIAIALLIPTLRRLAVYLGIGTHLFILMALGPLGHNWNMAVWPWNFFMIGMLWLLFDSNSSWGPEIMLRIKTFPAKAVVILCFGIIPVFYSFGYVHSYFAWGMYSGKNTYALISPSVKIQNNMPVNLKEMIMPNRYFPDGVLYPAKWSQQEMNVLPFPSAYVYSEITKAICERFSEAGGKVSTKIYFWKGGKYVSKIFNCSAENSNAYIP